MAPRTGALVLALLGVVLMVACSVQGVAVAGDVVTGNVGGTVNVSSEVTTVGEVQKSEVVSAEVDDVDEADLGISEFDDSEEVEEEGSSTMEVESTVAAADAVDSAPEPHRLMRILHERSSKRCLTKKHCKKHYKKAGCCKRKCVNLASDKNCGKCGKCCNTKKGYHCRSGKCLKPKKYHVKPHKHYKKPKKHYKKKPTHKHHKKKPVHKYHKKKPVHKYHKQKPVHKYHKKKPVHKYHKKKPAHKHHKRKPVHKHHKKPIHPHHQQCGYHKKCAKGHTCCKGKCVNLKSNKGHCGKCGKGCRYGSACCNGKCLNVKHDDRNCGKCGQRCGYGRKCCNGCCKNVFGDDKHNCGGCGKKCYTMCKFGMCGYGH